MFFRETHYDDIISLAYRKKTAVRAALENLIICGLLNYIIFNEIFNKFEAAKARNLCLSSWIITSKTLQFFSAKLMLVGVMEEAKNSVRSLDFAAEL